MNDIFRHIHMPPQLACEFLAVFSRMEYALKATGTYAMGSDGDKVSANWDKFANESKKEFSAIKDDGFQASVSYLLGQPPRKQILEKGVVRFVDQQINKAESTAQQTLLMIRTVRNNLFHGGKHYPNGETEPGRNQVLVTHALVVLKHCATLNNEVRLAYEH